MTSTAERYELALVRVRSGHWHDAEQICRQIIDAVPDHAEAWQLLGVAAHQVGKAEEAIKALERAVELMPDVAEAHFNLGVALKTAGRLEEAITSYRRSVMLDPNAVAAWNNLGDALQARGYVDEAVSSYQQALRLRPTYGEAHNNLGNAYRQQGKLSEALECYRRALEAKGDFAEAFNNAGSVYEEQGRFEEALRYYARALQLNPNYADAHNNLGTTCKALGRLDEAAACFKRALGLRPDYAEAHCNLSSVRLVRGDLMAGWQEFEWRWKTGVLPVPKFDRPMWEGQPVAGKTLLLCAEQGLGDTIQFIRYAKVLKAAGAKVVLQCQPPLIRLLSSYRWIDRVVAAGKDIPAFDFYTPLMSVPLHLETSLENIPAEVPYLFAEPSLVMQWRSRLEAVRGFRVGINWHGRLGCRESLERDIPREMFESLAQIPGVRLVSLQKKETEDSRQETGNEAGAAHPAIVEFGELDTVHGPFMDTAAIMMNLNLVITSDTSVPHLAGALGVPVWLAVPFAHDWRWFLDRSDSPWYPTMRLFRQQARGDWRPIFAEISKELSRKMHYFGG